MFAETGFVVTPFLPGDSLLFAAGALAAVDTSGTLSAPLLSLLLVIAAVAGNTTNYHIGRWIGPPAFSGKYRFLKVEYLQRTEAFFAKYGSMTIVLSRFVPIIRTCAPFVAGVARMPYARFQAYNFAGGIAWVLAFVWAGFFFGNIPLIKNNFGFVTIGIIVVSLIPVVVDGPSKVRASERRATAASPIASTSTCRSSACGAPSPTAACWRAGLRREPASRRAKRAACTWCLAADVELDAHIDVLLTPQRMRLILLPTPGMPTSDAVIVEDFLFERGAADATVVRLMSSGVPAAPGVGDVLSAASAATGSWR